MDEKPQDEEPETSKTTSSKLKVIPPPSKISICSQLEEAIWNPQSPVLTPSPEGSAEIISILQRLEVIETESRELLSRLLSMLQTDARLERYIRRRLSSDHRISQMWNLVEQILATQQGRLDVETMIQQSEDKDVKENESEIDDDLKNEWFKVTQFDKDKPGAAGVDQPTPVNPPSTTHN